MTGRLPLWTVLFTFAHFGISLGWKPLRDVLGFPLFHVLSEETPLVSILFANSVLWAMAFVAMVIFVTRRP